MGNRKRFHKPGGTYFVTSKTYKSKTYFNDPKLCQALVKQFNHYKEQIGFDLLAYTVQPDHYHLLLETPEDNDLSDIIHRINSYSATKINEKLKNQTKEKIWQGKPWTETIRNDNMFWQKLAYILLNPWRDGLVDNPLKEYKFSNLSEWKQQKGEDFLLDLFSRFGRYQE